MRNKEIIENISMVSINQNSAIFKNLDLLISSIDYLPKELSKLFKEIKENLLKKKVKEVIEFLMKNLENFGLKVLIDKKSEKNFFHLQRYFAKEAIKKNRFDLKNCYFNCLSLFLLEMNYFFIIPIEEKAIIVLNRTLIEITNEVENKKMFNGGLENFNRIIGKENEQEEAYFTFVKEMESFVEILLKILKI